MNRDVITDDGINYRGKERSIILGWRSETKRKVGDNRGQTLQIPVDEIDRVFQAGFTDLPPIQRHCFPSHFVRDLARRISRRRCVNYSLRIRPVGVKLANNFTSP